jgi:hypothetical protein
MRSLRQHQENCPSSVSRYPGSSLLTVRLLVFGAVHEHGDYGGLLP